MDLKKHDRLIIMLALCVVTFFAYWQIKGAGFIPFDDPDYVLENPYVQKGLTVDSVKWAFSVSNEIQTYFHPLTWISLMTDFSLFGLNPLGYHYVNLLIHILNAVLLFCVLRYLTGYTWRSALVAFLFALHPLNVESVAWVTERKNVLSGFFALISIWAYGWYSRRPHVLRYLAVFFLFAASILSKPTTIFLPFLLLVLDAWPLARFRFREEASPVSAFAQLLAEKVPLLLVSGVAVAVAVKSNEAVMHNSDNMYFVDYGYRTANALVSYAAYMGKLLWPTCLAVFYPLQKNYPFWEVFGAVAILLGTSSVIWWGGRRYPWVPAGWLWYLGALFPAIGFVRNGRWPAMADRFTYLASIGLFMIVSWGLAELADRFPKARTCIACFAGFWVFALGVCTFIQTGYWRNGVTLFSHAMEVTKNNHVAAESIGNHFFQKGEYATALAYYAVVRDSQPANAIFEFANGVISCKQGRLKDAVEWSNLALSKDDNYMPALLLLGDIYRAAGDEARAAQYYQKVVVCPKAEAGGVKARARQNLQTVMERLKPTLDALRMRVAANPGNIRLRGELALKLDSLGLDEEALQHYLAMERAGFQGWQLFYNMARLFDDNYDFERAVRYYKASLSQNPSYPDAWNNLGVLCKKRGDLDQAIAYFEKAIATDARFPLAPFNLATIYVLQRDREKALAQFKLVQERFPELRMKTVPYLKILE